MPRASATVERRIAAAPESVYAVLADYRTHHPRIMPSSFSGLEVEQGGVGEGTVFHITFTTLGRTQLLRMRVAEPEPGRALTETDLDSGLVTTFVVEPGRDGASARITSEWDVHGIAGRIDALLRPRLLRRVFAQQLALLDEYLRGLGGRAA